MKRYVVQKGKDFFHRHVLPKVLPEPVLDGLSDANESFSHPLRAITRQRSGRLKRSKKKEHINRYQSSQQGDTPPSSVPDVTQPIPILVPTHHTGDVDYDYVPTERYYPWPLETQFLYGPNSPKEETTAMWMDPFPQYQLPALPPEAVIWYNNWVPTPPRSVTSTEEGSSRPSTMSHPSSAKGLVQRPKQRRASTDHETHSSLMGSDRVEA